MTDAAKKVDPEEERKILDYIRAESLRGQDPKSVRLKLMQAGWAENEVLRLIEVALTKPDFQAAKEERQKILEIEQALVFQKDGNLKLERDIIDGKRRKKRVDDELTELPKPIPELPKKQPMTPEQWARIVRTAAQLSLGGLVLYHAFLLCQKYLG
jgi:hypothetical protein